jgi:hypothetical protein
MSGEVAVWTQYVRTITETDRWGDSRVTGGSSGDKFIGVAGITDDPQGRRRLCASCLGEREVPEARKHSVSPANFICDNCGLSFVESALKRITG